jgi:hypothetical protein
LAGSVTIQQGTGITDFAPVGVGLAAVPVLAAGSGRHRIVFQANILNTGEIRLGGAGVTMAGSPIGLLPGEQWIEDAAADAGWFAISDTAAQVLRVQVG